VRHVPRQASQLSGTYLPDDFSCDAWRGTYLTGRRDTCQTPPWLLRTLHLPILGFYALIKRTLRASLAATTAIEQGRKEKQGRGIGVICIRRISQGVVSRGYCKGSSVWRCSIKGGIAGGIAAILWFYVYFLCLLRARPPMSPYKLAFPLGNY